MWKDKAHDKNGEVKTSTDISFNIFNNNIIQE